MRIKCEGKWRGNNERNTGIATTNGDLRGHEYVTQYKLPKTYTYMNVIKMKLTSNWETKHHRDFFLSKEYSSSGIGLHFIGLLTKGVLCISTKEFLLLLRLLVALHRQTIRPYWWKKYLQYWVNMEKQFWSHLEPSFLKASIHSTGTGYQKRKVNINPATNP